MGVQPAIDIVDTAGNCAECYFEEPGKHSQACSLYKAEPAPKVCRMYDTSTPDKAVCGECGITFERHPKPIEPVEKPVEKVHETNPNGANQYQLDPRQRLCWKLYITPGGKTFGNAYQSAIAAGYEESTALHITMSKWFLDKVRRMGLLSKAENVLEEMLDMPVTVLDLPTTFEEHYPHTPEDEEYDADEEAAWNGRRDQRRARYIVTDSALVKIKQDTAKFVAERQGKDEGWNNRTEVTGKNGKDLVPVDPKAKELGNKAIQEFLDAGASISPPNPQETDELA